MGRVNNEFIIKYSYNINFIDDKNPSRREDLHDQESTDIGRVGL